jgi:hypothetical protein
VKGTLKKGLSWHDPGVESRNKLSGWVDSDFASDMEAAGRKGTRPSEKAKMPEEALLTRSSKATKPMNACVHTYTKSQTPSTRRRGLSWRIHGSVEPEDTKVSTNEQHSLLTFASR